MAEWVSKTIVDVGDAYGNHMRVAIGRVTVGRRTTGGLQLNPENPDPHDLPHLTFDIASGVDLITEIRHQLTSLGGGL